MNREKVIKGLEEIQKHLDTGYSFAISWESELIRDAIELLKERETMHWISVNDRLPTYAELKDDRVLALLDDGTIYSTGFDECIENASTFGGWRQNFDPVTLGATDSYWMPLEGVTHWMPIPKQIQEGR